MEWIRYDNEAVRLTGRFYMDGEAACTTACGSYIEAAFAGESAVLHFDMKDLVPSYPQVYLQVDGGVLSGAAVASRLTVRMPDGGAHVLKIIFKSANENQSRWQAPVAAKLAFLGLEAEAAGKLPPDTRKTITFIGDSITEGILIFPERAPYKNSRMDRTFQDDVTYGYAWQTANALNLRPTFCAYGAVGFTKGGSGGVPPVGDSYADCVEGVPWREPYTPDYICINHGCNDRGKEPESVMKAYRAFLDAMGSRYPKTQLIVLAPFCGVFGKELGELVAAYNEAHGTNILFINTEGWVPKEPIHPLADGHRVIAKHLTGILKETLKSAFS